MKKKGFLRNILDDLLGVDADKAHETSNNEEMEALSKITHRKQSTSEEDTVGIENEAQDLDFVEDLTTIGMESQARRDAPEPVPSEAPAPVKEKPIPRAKAKKSTVVPIRKEMGPPRTRPAPKSQPKNTIHILSFLELVQLGRKTCKLTINLDDWEHNICIFKNGILQDDFFILDTEKFLENEQEIPSKAVLLVDEDKTQIAALASELQAYQNVFTVQTAANGKQAVRILETKPIDLLVTGLKMSEMDGFELLNYMKARFPAVPTIVISIFDFAEMHKRLETLGAVKHLIKPFETFELADTITDLFDTRTGKKSIKGASLMDFLKMLELDQLTCSIEITKAQEGTCICLVYGGKLVNLDCGGLKGKEAAQVLTSMDSFNITLNSA